MWRPSTSRYLYCMFAFSLLAIIGFIVWQNFLCLRTVYKGAIGTGCVCYCNGLSNVRHRRGLWFNDCAVRYIRREENVYKWLMRMSCIKFRVFNLLELHYISYRKVSDKDCVFYCIRLVGFLLNVFIDNKLFSDFQYRFKSILLRLILIELINHWWIKRKSHQGRT